MYFMNFLLFQKKLKIRDQVTGTLSKSDRLARLLLAPGFFLPLALTGSSFASWLRGLARRGSGSTSLPICAPEPNAFQEGKPFPP
jgi:hypothetical protein